MADGSLLAIVPARDEAATVGTVIADLRAEFSDVAVLVVNDGSSDRTSEVARAHGARVLDLPFRSGVGAAMRLGYRVAHAESFAWAVRVDADGQHPAAAARRVLEAAQEQQLDLVIGTRSDRDVTMPSVLSPRRLAMRLLATQVSRASGTRIPDATSGLRVTSAACTALYAREFPCEFFADTVEPIALAARAGLRIGTCPVRMLPRAHGRGSHGSFAASFHVARSALALTIGVRDERGVPRQA